MTLQRGAATILILLCAAGCVRREGRNADCRWPGEGSSGRRVDARHLSADAEFAEDLAIRYADTHHGLRTPYYVSGEVYAAERDRCMGALFQSIAKQHSVPVEQVAGALGRNRGWIDAGVNLPFLLLYGWAAAAVSRLLWRRYPPAELGWVPGTFMALFLSLAFAAGGIGLGELWSSLAETWRVGNGHMSYRGARLPWERYRAAIFAVAFIVFWLAVVWAARRERPRHPRAA